MIAPRIDTHIKLARHVAVHTGAAGRRNLMSVVCGVIVSAGQMTLGAHAVALCNQLVAVRVMAIGAGHPSLMHLALNERAVNIDLLADLPIGPVKRLLNNRQAVGIQ